MMLGLFDRRPRWAPTLRGWLCLGLLLVGTTGATFWTIYPFLAANAPLAAEVLVVEGWIPDYAILRCAMEMKAGSHTHVLTVGGPVTGVASPAADDDTHAYQAAKIFVRAGWAPGTVAYVASNRVSRDRTFHSAITLKSWLEKKQLQPRAINVVTLGAHARRSRMLFQRALGPDVEVGIISIPNQEFEPASWWRYSEGVKEVLSEAAGYLYARFFFFPSAADEARDP